MAVARQHHYVPRCYLKGFTVPRRKKRQVVVFDRVDGRSFTTAVDNVAAERDFNRIEVEGHEPDALETLIAEFEGELAPALERIIASNSIANERDRAHLLNFVALVAMRNPRWREVVRTAHERFAKMMAREMVSTPEHWAAVVKGAREHGVDPGEVDYETAHKLVEEDAYTVSVATEHRIAMEFGSSMEILPYLIDRKWVLLKAAPSTGGFVTSDHPVCLTWSDPWHGRSAYSPGFGLKGTRVIFPISTDLAMIGEFEQAENVRETDEVGVAEINTTIAHRAKRQVYARDMHFQYANDDGKPRKAAKLASERWFRKPGKAGPQPHVKHDA